MDIVALDRLFRAWVVVALVVGAVAVTTGGELVASVGVVIIILGLMGLMPVVYNGMTGRESRQSGQ